MEEVNKKILRVNKMRNSHINNNLYPNLNDINYKYELKAKHNITAATTPTRAITLPASERRKKDVRKELNYKRLNKTMRWAEAHERG